MTLSDLPGRDLPPGEVPDAEDQLLAETIPPTALDDDRRPLPETPEEVHVLEATERRRPPRLRVSPAVQLERVRPAPPGEQVRAGVGLSLIHI